MIRQFPRPRHPARHLFPTLFSIGAIALCSLILSACTPQESTQNHNTYVQITKPSFVKSWDVQLSLHAGDSIKGIYYLDNTVHVLTDMNYDHAVKADSGFVLYRNEIATPYVSLKGGPTLVSGSIVFPTTHTLEVYSRAGTFQRSIDVKYNITNQAVGNTADGHPYVYFGLDFNKGCLAQADVTQQIDPVQWTFLTFGSVDGPVAISENVVYSASEDGSLRACLEDRTAFWPLLDNSTFATGSKILGGVAVDGGNVYFSTLAGKLYCLDKNTGKLKWQCFASVGLEQGPQVTDSAVYQYIPDQGLAAVDKSTKLNIGDGEQADESPFHTPRWILKGASRILEEDEQYVYVILGGPDEMRGLAAVDKHTGQLAFRTHRRDLIFVSADPKTFMIYGVTKNGLVVALKPTLVPGSYGEIALNTQPTFDGFASHAP